MRNIGIPDPPLAPEVVALARQYGHRRDAILDILRTLHDTHGGLTDTLLARDVGRLVGRDANVCPAAAR